LRGTGADGRGVSHVSPASRACFLLDRKSVIHLQVESGTLGWESLSRNRAGMIVLKAELKSRNRILA